MRRTAANSGAVEQIAEEQTDKNNRAAVREKLGIDSLNEELKSSDDTVELQYNGEEQGSYSRITVIPVDRDENGRLHHIIPGGRDEDSIFCWDYPLPCSYNDYCSDYIKKVTKESLVSYRITGSSERLRGCLIREREI